MDARAIAITVISVLAFDAAAQTREELASLDYGSCPTGYEETIQSRFQNSPETAYEGTPILWPPQKYWTYDTPAAEDSSPGRKLLAGYLVAVTVDQVRGPDRPAGRYVYGFLFKNNELIAMVRASEIQAPRIAEEVGPIPRDEREWKIIYSKISDTGKPAGIIQFEPAGESSGGTPERISFLVTGNDSLRRGPPQRLVERNMDMYRRGCTSATQEIISQTRTEILYERKVTGCGQARYDRYWIEKYVEGIATMTTVSYQRTAPFPQAEREKWIKLVGDAKLTVKDECKQP